MRIRPEVRRKVTWLIHTCSVPTVGALFLLVGGSKLLSAVFVNAEVITGLDPVFGQPWRLVLIGAGIVETAAGVSCLFLPNRSIRVHSLLCLMAALIGYRIIFWFSGSPESCHCLNSLVESTGLSFSESKGEGMALFLLGFGTITGFAGRIWRA